ncbi:MAG: hypothetical protein JRI68_19300 [Deltaproteobacteria bacterium]|nr:hypothetical protein [Deltaproteobacteria bacterium]
MRSPASRQQAGTGQRRPWKWLAVGGLAAAAVLAWQWPRLALWKLEHDAGGAVAAVSQCLVGPGAVGGQAGDRLRSISIQASLDQTSGSWPRQCAPYVGALRRALERLHGQWASCEGAGCCTGCEELLQLRNEVDRATVLTDQGYHDAFDPDRLLQLARELGLAGCADEDVPTPPAPVALLRPGTMEPLHRGDYLRLLTDPNGHDSLALLFYTQRQSYRLCGLRLVGDDHASCWALADSIPVGQAGMLLAAEPGAPVRLYAQGPSSRGWQQGLFDARSGQRLVALSDRPAGGFVWRDGSFARLGREAPGEGLSLYRLRVGEIEAAVPIEVTGASMAPRLAHDEIIWAEPLEGHRHRVYARRVFRHGAPLGPSIRVGDTPPMVGTPNMNTCRTERGLVLLVGGLPRGASRARQPAWARLKDLDPGAAATLMFRTEAGWDKPVPVRMGPRAGLTCQGETATLSWVGALEEKPDPTLAARQLSEHEPPPVRGRYEVRRLRCGPGSCERERAVVMLERYSEHSRYLAGDVGDAAVVFWRSPLGDIRMRVATLDALPTAPSRALFDDLEHDGFGWDLERATFFGRGGTVLVLVSAPLGDEGSATYGFRVSAAGSITPVRVAGEHGQLGGTVMGRVAAR